MANKKSTAKKTGKTSSTKKTKVENTVKPKAATPKGKKGEQYMLRKSGIDKQGNQQYTAIRVYQRKPNGWKVTEGALTAPIGYKWINNGKSLFKGYKAALLQEKERK